MADTHFDSKNLGLRAQKKLLGKMANKKFAKVFIDDTSGRLLDNLHRMVRDHTHSRKTADRLVKDLIKIMIKVALLYRNDALSSDELTSVTQTRHRLRQLAMTVVSFYEVDFTYDGIYLRRLLDDCTTSLRKLAVSHLSDKSVERVDRIASFLMDGDGFVDAMFSASQRAELGRVVAGLRRLIDEDAL